MRTGRRYLSSGQLQYLPFTKPASSESKNTTEFAMSWAGHPAAFLAIAKPSPFFAFLRVTQQLRFQMPRLERTNPAHLVDGLIPNGPAFVPPLSVVNPRPPRVCAGNMLGDASQRRPRPIAQS